MNSTPEERPQPTPAPAPVPSTSPAVGNAAPSESRPASGSPGKKKSGGAQKKLLGFLAVVAAALFLFKGDDQMEDHANMKFHDGLSSGQLAKVRAGSATVVSAVAVAATDINDALSSSAASMAASGQVDELADSLTTPGLQGKPTVAPKMANELAGGQRKIFTVTLFDTCAEDGDIVEVMVDGMSYAIVPLTHTGAVVNLPLKSDGASLVTLRGTKDGEGGITVGCRTSQGDFFSSVIQEGQVTALRFGM